MTVPHIFHLLCAFTFAVSACVVTEFDTAARVCPEVQRATPAEVVSQENRQTTKEEAEVLRLVELSHSLYEQGKLDEALTEAERGLRYAEQNFAADALAVGGALLNLGSLLISKGDLARAEPVELRGIAILKKRLGTEFNEGASLGNLAADFEGRGDAAGAVRLYTLAVKATEQEVGPDHLELAGLLNKLGAAHRRQGDYRQSSLAYERALSIQDKKLGPDHAEVGWTLNRRAGVLRLLGDLDLAEQHYGRALRLIEAVKGPESVDAAIITDNLGLVYGDKGDLERAEQLHKRALGIFEKAYGADHPDVATALDNLASVYADKGDYAQAEQHHKRVLAMREKVLGAGHPDVATSRDNLAVLYQKKGDYAAAEHLHREALATIEKTYGPEHPFTAEFIANLAGFYRNTGNYVQAERLYRRALAIGEKTYGAVHRITARRLNSLADVLELKGGYVDAILVYRRALAVALKTDGPESMLAADILDGLAEMYDKIGYSELHDEMHRYSLAIRRKINGPDDPSLLGHYAALYFREGKLAEAEKFFKLALAARVEKLGEEHPVVATVLENLAIIYHRQGRYAEADAAYRRVMAIQEKRLGPRHPTVGHTHFHLSMMQWARGDIDQSLRRMTHAQEIYEHNLSNVLTTGSGTQKGFYIMAITPPTAAAITLNVHSAPENVEATRVALTAILRRKGRSLDAMTDQVGALRGRLSLQDQALFDRLKSAQARLAAYAFKDAERDDPTRLRVEVAKLESEVEALEAQISDHSAEFREQAQPVTIESVQQLIPADAALVEIFAYETYNPKHQHHDDLYGPGRYVAYVLHREGPPALVELGLKDGIDRLAGRLRAALRSRASANVKQAARALDEAVMRPVRRRLGDKRLVLLSPDGALNLIPFGALVDERGRYLVENYTFAYLTSGRDLLRLKTQTAERQEAVIIAAPAFEGAAGAHPVPAPSIPADPDSERRFDFTKLVIKPLPYTAEEAKDLKRILPDARVLMGIQATEAALKQVAGPRLLHVATHGFFLPRDAQAERSVPKRMAARQHRHGRERELVMGEPSTPAGVWDTRPLLRSGLVLAGVKRGQSGAGQDGVLTALEVAGLDLWGTKLVVLSSCDTGVGDVSTGEGVYGLRRALVLAGAESELMSLWPVSDAATRHLMVAYYQRLLEGFGRAESLRQVQLETLRSGRHSHPFYWASFIPLGDWRGL